MFLVGNSKHSRNEIIKMDGRKYVFFPKDLVADFLIYIANESLSSRRLQIKITESPDFKFTESKKMDGAVKPVVNQSPAVPEKAKDFREIPGWTSEELENFFTGDTGKELLLNICSKTEFAPRHLRIIKEYKSADRLLYSNPSDYYWTPENRSIPPTMRTPLTNLTRLLFVNSVPKAFLNSEEQGDFLKSNINSLWKFIYGKDIGGGVEGLPGIFLSKEEYVNAIYLLENVLKERDLNPKGVGVTREFVKSDRPRSGLVY
jgi:hypothetical protein